MCLSAVHYPDELIDFTFRDTLRHPIVHSMSGPILDHTLGNSLVRLWMVGRRPSLLPYVNLLISMSLVRRGGRIEDRRSRYLDSLLL